MKPSRIKLVDSRNPEAINAIGNRLNAHSSQGVCNDGFAQQNFICK
jgi:hypothetical protein